MFVERMMSVKRALTRDVRNVPLGTYGMQRKKAAKIVKKCKNTFDDKALYFQQQ